VKGKEICVKKLDLRIALFIADSFTSFLDNSPIAVNSGHAARRPNELGHKQQNIPHSTAKVQHAHSRFKSG
jgi:hypothetical protein